MHSDRKQSNLPTFLLPIQISPKRKQIWRVWEPFCTPAHPAGFPPGLQPISAIAPDRSTLQVASTVRATPMGAERLCRCFVCDSLEVRCESKRDGTDGDGFTSSAPKRLVEETRFSDLKAGTRNLGYLLYIEIVYIG